MEIETKRVNSKLFRYYELFFYLTISTFLLSMMLGYNKWNRSIIEQYQLKWFFKDWQTFESMNGIFFLISAAFSAFFGLKYFDHDLGAFKLNEARLFANGIIFHLDKMKQIKFTINSPGVFGTRNVRQGFKNWVEFLVDNESKKYEFYIENQAMEDTLMNLLAELKTKHAIEVVVDKRSKESLFESWFGYG